MIEISLLLYGGVVPELMIHVFMGYIVVEDKDFAWYIKEK
jgi:hypothetical protein